VPGMRQSSSRPGAGQQNHRSAWRVPPDAGWPSLRSYRAKEGADVAWAPGVQRLIYPKI
jgi:hypothetical protein